jgi:glycosyltransferase involved in cell wall biosynthesis
LESVEQNIPLVSIIVITYNSSKFVLETLESAKVQTYQNIELIISDDASQDDTVEICENWLSKNRERFVHTDLITNKINTGISANCNRGVKVSQGVWIKLIAGDDFLKKDCIEYCINEVVNKNYDIFFTKIEFTSQNTLLLETIDIGFRKIESRNLLHTDLLKNNFLPAPSAFIKKSIYLLLNGFDESFEMIEDYPFWLKAIKLNLSFGFSNLKKVYYRVSNQGVSQKKHFEDKNIFYKDIKYTNSWYKFLWKILIPEQLKNYLFFLAFRNLYNYIQFKLLTVVFYNKRTVFSNLVFYLFEIFKPSFKKKNNV